MTNPDTTGAERAPKPDVAPVPQTEGEEVCPNCEGAQRVILDPMKGSFTSPCPICSGTGKEGEK